ncbi:MAG: hypothetical protein MJD61_12345 [Proteobacteria bacterium]|nr:hypothetical protein [Pseudomonadota bacterium]
MLSLKKATEYTEVSLHVMLRLIACGLVTNEQTVPRAPFEIRKADLDSAKVKDAIRRFKQTGRLAPKRGDSTNQQPDLF